MRLSTLFVILCSVCTSNAQDDALRGSTSDTAYTNQFYTTLAAGLMLRDTTADTSGSPFKMVPRFANVADRLDSLAKRWPVGCDDLSVSGEPYGPLNVVRLTICREIQPPPDQFLFYYAPSDTSATVLRMELAPYGSALYRTAAVQLGPPFPSGEDPHLGRIVLLNIAAGLVRGWYGVEQR